MLFDWVKASAAERHAFVNSLTEATITSIRKSGDISFHYVPQLYRGSRFDKGAEDKWTRTLRPFIDTVRPVLEWITSLDQDPDVPSSVAFLSPKFTELTVTWTDTRE